MLSYKIDFSSCVIKDGLQIQSQMNKCFNHAIKYML